MCKRTVEKSPTNATNALSLILGDTDLSKDHSPDNSSKPSEEVDQGEQQARSVHQNLGIHVKVEIGPNPGLSSCCEWSNSNTGEWLPLLDFLCLYQSKYVQMDIVPLDGSNENSYFRKICMGTSNTGKWGENLCISWQIWANGRMGKNMGEWVSTSRRQQPPRTETCILPRFSSSSSCSKLPLIFSPVSASSS